MFGGNKFIYHNQGNKFRSPDAQRDKAAESGHSNSKHDAILPEDIKSIRYLSSELISER